MEMKVGSGVQMLDFIGAMHKERTLYRCDGERLTRHFCGWMEPSQREAVWSYDEDQLRALLSSHGYSPRSSVPLYQWASGELFRFRQLPRDTLAQIYQEASDDLADIEKYLHFCTKKVAEFSSKQTEEGRASLNFYKHFFVLNQQAKDEIGSALASLLSGSALCEYTPASKFSSSAANYRWSYRWTRRSLDPSGYSRVRHCFSHGTPRDVEAMVAAFEAQEWSSFDSALRSYIAAERVPLKLQLLIDRNHRLNERKSVLLPALEAYSRGDIALFSSAIATQIEGVFEDACTELGVSDCELRQATLVPKVDAFKRHASFVSFDYVYYAIWFPLLRNHVAHGRLINKDERRTADMLLLDLLYVCEILSTLPTPANRMTEFLSEITMSWADAKTHELCQFTTEQELRFACLLVENAGAEPSTFYGVDPAFQLLKERLESDRFVDTLSRLGRSSREPLGVPNLTLLFGLQRLATRFIKLLPSNRDRWREILSGVGKLDGEYDFEWADFLLEARQALAQEDLS